MDASLPHHEYVEPIPAPQTWKSSGLPSTMQKAMFVCRKLWPLVTLWRTDRESTEPFWHSWRSGYWCESLDT